MLAPALFLSILAIELAITASAGSTMSEAKIALYIYSSASIIAVIIYCWREISSVSLGQIAVVASSSTVVMLPWLIHGIADFPGSWFWDGFSYLASAETMKNYPWRATETNVPPLFELGLIATKGRFITPSVIAFFEGLLPPGGDTQMAVGYVLAVYVATLSFSAAYLARTLFPSRNVAGYLLTFLVTVSGFTLTFLHSNNFDQLLSMALMPAIMGLSLSAGWKTKISPLLLGLMSGALIVIYPELAFVMLLCPAFILIYRLWVEKPSAADVVVFTGIAAATLAASVAPIAETTAEFLYSQANAGLAEAGTERPGEGFFPTFYDYRCLGGAFMMLYPPFSECVDVKMYLIGTVGAAIFILGGFGAALARGKLIPIASYVALVTVLSSYLLITKNYEYGAYKILSAALPAFSVLLIYISFVAVPNELARKFVILFVPYCIVIGYRLFELDKSAIFKSTELYRGLQQSIPLRSLVYVKIRDAVSFQWSIYYLREHFYRVLAGSLVYVPRSTYSNPSPPFEQPVYLVSDDRNDTCWGNSVWSSRAVQVYLIESPTEGLSCDPETGRPSMGH